MTTAFSGGVQSFDPGEVVLQQLAARHVATPEGVGQRVRGLQSDVRHAAMPFLLSKEYKLPDDVPTLTDWPKIRRKAGFRVSELTGTGSKARSLSSRARPAARAAATPCGWRRRAPTSSPSTSASRSRTWCIRRPHLPTSPRPPNLSRKSAGASSRAEVDVRDYDALAAAVDDGVEQLGQTRHRRRQRGHRQRWATGCTRSRRTSGRT